jgi:hypothetical protein
VQYLDAVVPRGISWPLYYLENDYFWFLSEPDVTVPLLVWGPPNGSRMEKRANIYV